MPTPAEILARMQSHEHHFALRDPAAFRLLRERIQAVARRGDFITYSELVEGVTFNIPNINGGNPYRIDTAQWIDLDRLLIGEFLGLISTESFRDHGYMLSSLVVRKGEPRPSEHFFEWMHFLELIPDLTEESVDEFWSQQVRLAFEHLRPTRGRSA